MSDFDAIVIGSGMSGGWSIKELAERGLKVLVLDRGKKIIPAEDYSDMEVPWQKKNLDRVNETEAASRYPTAPEYAFRESNKHLFAREDESSYETVDGTGFKWTRGYSSGGKSLLWSRQTYRLGPEDFLANKKDGHGIDWPIRYEDLAPWYDKVERFAGISGQAENIPQLPDSVFQPPFPLNCAESAFKSRVEQAFPSRRVIQARVAHLTQPTDEQRGLGRNKCLGRVLCHHGCTFGAYFSSVSSTLPAAEKTGNVTHVEHAIVHSIDYEPTTNRVTKVNVIDANTKERRSYSARVIMLNAGTIPTAGILLNSVSEQFPNGLANSSGQLGRNIMDHVMGANGSAVMPGFKDRYLKGKNPGGIYIPRYVNFDEEDDSFVRGFGIQGAGERAGWDGRRPGLGQDFKRANRTPGDWTLWLTSFGEILPNPNNRMTMHSKKRDKWGLPMPVFECRMSQNELKILQRAGRDIQAMFEAAGCENISVNIPKEIGDLSRMGRGIHEMGTARMGRSPAESVLNGNNQSHDVPNLFVSDGSAMTSSACQNPSLTYMALAARAANYAADLIQEGTL